jgi:hypothetical protein
MILCLVQLWAIHKSVKHCWLDIYVEDDTNTIYNIEIQTTGLTLTLLKKVKISIQKGLLMMLMMMWKSFWSIAELFEEPLDYVDEICHLLDANPNLSDEEIAELLGWKDERTRFNNLAVREMSRACGFAVKLRLL